MGIGVIVPSTVPTQVGDMPSVLDAHDLRPAADRLDPAALDTRPDTVVASRTADRDPASDSVTAQEVLGHLVGERLWWPRARRTAPRRTWCAPRAILRGRRPQR
jgi:hypothetical protein